MRISHGQPGHQIFQHVISFSGVSEISSLQSSNTPHISWVETKNSTRSQTNSCGNALNSNGWCSQETYRVPRAEWWSSEWWCLRKVRLLFSMCQIVIWVKLKLKKTKLFYIYSVFKYNAIKSTITYAAETWCLKAKTVAKLNSTKLDFWRRSARSSRKDKIRNNIIKQKMNVTTCLLDDIKTKQLQWYGNVQRMEEWRLPKEVIKWRPPGRGKRGRPKLTWAEGIGGLMRENGIIEEDWNDRRNWRKKII